MDNAIQGAAGFEYDYNEGGAGTLYSNDDQYLVDSGATGNYAPAAAAVDYHEYDYADAYDEYTY